MTDKKVIVIGLDGATWDLMKPWAEKGILPTFKKLMEEGSFGSLKTAFGKGRFFSKSIQSGTAWVSFATGKEADKHGIHFFRDKHGKFVSSTSVKGKKIWDYLGESGKKVVVMNIPVTYPPQKVNGYMITGMLTPPNSDNWTYPKTLKEELGDFIPHWPKHKEYIAKYPNIDYTAYLKDICEYNEKRKEIVKLLLKNKNPDFFAVNFHEMDEVQHICWHLLDENHPQYDSKLREMYGNPILDFYKFADSIVGELINFVNDNIDGAVNIFMISDHGLGSKYKGYTLASKLLILIQRILARLPRKHLMASHKPVMAHLQSPNPFVRKHLMASHKPVMAHLQSPNPFVRKHLMAGHTPYGIFFAIGHDIKKSTSDINGLNLIDLAPTILHIFDIPIPKDMDGKVLKKIFKEDSEPAKREIEYQEEADEKEIVKEKIKKLRVVGKI